MKLYVLLNFLVALGCVMCHHDDDHHDHDHHDHDHKENKESIVKAGDIKNLVSDGIVPDGIDKAPSKPLKVTYAKEEVNFGNELTPTQVKDEPKVSWDVEKDALYTLAMIDLDAPSRKTPMVRAVNHWLVSNIHGNDISSGEVITAYLGSGPPKSTGLHRYVFLAFKQPKKLTIDEPKTSALSREHRLRFDMKKFAEKYGLGAPVAGNYYKAKWDEYVDERNKKIKT